MRSFLSNRTFVSDFVHMTMRAYLAFAGKYSDIRHVCEDICKAV